MNRRRVAIVTGGRTPFVKAGKTFKDLGPLKLACHAVNPKTAKLPKSWLGVFFGGYTRTQPRIEELRRNFP